MNQFDKDPSRLRSRRHSSPSLRRGVDILLAVSPDVRSVSVVGKENMSLLEPGVPAIVAVSHNTGYDVPIVVKALGQDLDLAITDQSTHHSIQREANMFLTLNAIGMDNFIPVGYTWEDDKKIPGVFNPDETLPMIDAMNNGKSIVIAAHNPIDQSSDLAKAPSPGHLAAYLALTTGAPIIPVFVSLDPADKSALATIGQPFRLDMDLTMDRYRTLLGKRKGDARLTADETKEFVSLAERLRQEAQVVFEHVTTLESTPRDTQQRVVGAYGLRGGHHHSSFLC